MKWKVIKKISGKPSGWESSDGELRIYAMKRGTGKTRYSVMYATGKSGFGAWKSATIVDTLKQAQSAAEDL